MSFYQDYNDKLAIEGWNTRAVQQYQHVDLRRLSPALGAEIRGVDLSQPLPPAQLEEIRQALTDFLVLTFPGQAIGATEHKAFARHFGSLHQHVLGDSTQLTARSDDPEILGWKTGRSTRYTAGDAWHNDVSCDPHPIWASLLRVTRLPEVGGGDTAFANLYLAYASLSDPLKQFLEGLSAVHDGKEGWSNGYGAEPKPGQVFNASEHPVVARHPVSGRKFLFVNEAFTSHIVQLSRAESRALLQLLFRHIEKHQSFQARIHWQPDTLLLWDNWATQHHAIWDYYPFERWGERVSAYRDHGPQAAASLLSAV
ncbi:taurine dioxygenase [Aquitalea sp. FJL05]|uniref:TauD/TfdA dioxygenase family protein n=1 Tax=Aquitalea TaxID=407217 RepID=UPI000F5AA89D|nr:MULTISPECIES: TauD/TfdA family dioxygenase [Aquitalea]RQO78294.1 taurine dioxygenase [Aquitalea sp. FJL05]